MGRKRTGIVLLSMFVLYGLVSGRVACAQLLRLAGKTGLRPMPRAKAWGKTPDKDIVLPLHYRTRVRPSLLIVGRDHPNGVRILALFVKDAVPLPLKFAKGFRGFNAYGELEPGYTVEVAEYDFNHDDAPEILVAVGNGVTDLACSIVRYHAPPTTKGAANAANWSLVGSFRGRTYLAINGDTLILPAGAGGRYKQYLWRKGRFVQKNQGAGTPQ